MRAPGGLYEAPWSKSRTACSERASRGAIPRGAVFKVHEQRHALRPASHGPSTRRHTSSDRYPDPNRLPIWRGGEASERSVSSSDFTLPGSPDLSEASPPLQGSLAQSVEYPAEDRQDQVQSLEDPFCPRGPIDTASLSEGEDPGATPGGGIAPMAQETGQRPSKAKVQVRVLVGVSHNAPMA